MVSIKSICFLNINEMWRHLGHFFNQVDNDELSTLQSLKAAEKVCVN